MKKQISFLFALFYFGVFQAQNNVLFDIYTDDYATETSWEIIDESNSQVVASNSNYTADFTQYPTQTIDLPNGNYTFSIFDSASDGICCQYGDGLYSLIDETTDIIIIEGGDFGGSESISFVLPYVPPIAGCTDPSAYNYNSQAVDDDGSCLFLESPLTIDLESIVTGLSSIVDITNAGDDRLFIVAQAGQIKILNPETGVVNPTNFLDISSIITSGGEQGLLGLAFHPEYNSNGYFFVNYTKPNGDTRIARYTVSSDPDVADPNSELMILEQDQPFGNHNAGDLNFGPDGYLYIPMGDGGSGGDPNNYSQSGDTWLGKMLRIDIDNTSETANYIVPADNPFVGSSEILNEVWAIGLRNVWRFSFDSETGEMWMGDVGQNAIEEIDHEPAGFAGGRNYGWRCYEGTADYNQSQCGGIDVSEVTFPVFEYQQSAGACAVTGGFVYRGTEFPAMVGKYFFVDYCNGVFRSLEPQGDGYFERNFGNGFGSYWTTFGEGSDGSIYASGSFGGTVYKLVDPCNDFIPTISIEENGDLTATAGTDYQWLVNNELVANTNQIFDHSVLGPNTYQVSVTNAAGCSKLSEIISLTAGEIILDLKTILQGPFDEASQLMNDQLRINDEIPSTEPYTSLGFNHVIGGGETTPLSTFDSIGNDAIVDWIFVELRDGNSPNTIVATQSALLQRDGDIVAMDGTSLVSFTDLNFSEVIVVLRHRNHFGVRTLNTYPTNQTIVIDFTSPNTLLFGLNPMIDIGSIKAMIAGDANRDGQINPVDKNDYWRVENGQPFDYFNTQADFNLDGFTNPVDKNNYWRLNNSKVEQVD